MSAKPAVKQPSRRRSPVTRPKTVTITPQRLGLSYAADLPAHWFANDPFLTSFQTAFCAQFPQGEKFLIQSVRLFREQIKDRQLQKDVSGFIGQEAHHAQAHALLNEFLATRGAPTARIDRQVKKILALICKVFPARDQMAMTAALEHFTSMFGSLSLENPDVIESVHPALRPLYLWHAIEETEHKGVAFDVYQTVDGDYLRLMRAYVISTALLVSFTAWFTALVMAADGSLGNVRSIARGLRWMFGYGEKAGHVRKMLPEFLDFFRRDFHPWDHDNSAQIEQWRPVLEQMLQSQARPTVAA